MHLHSSKSGKITKSGSMSSKRQSLYILHFVKASRQNVDFKTCFCQLMSSNDVAKRIFVIFSQFWRVNHAKLSILRCLLFWWVGIGQQHVNFQICDILKNFYISSKRHLTCPFYSSIDLPFLRWNAHHAKHSSKLIN